MCFIFWLFGISLLSSLIFILNIPIEELANDRGDTLHFLLLTCAVSFSIIKIYDVKEDVIKRLREIDSDKKKLDDEFKRRNERLEKDYEWKRFTLDKKYNEQMSFVEYSKIRVENLLKSTKPFSESSSMYADMKTVIFDQEKQYLRNKSHPAGAKTFEVIRSLKKQTKEAIENYKSMQYKYQFLLSVFPELSDYIDDDEDLIQMSKYYNIDEFNEDRDKVREWLNVYEYEKLSESERNQLALDRYMNRNKTKWEIGVEYELYIGYLLRTGALFDNSIINVVQYGESNGKNDLGRDIIAEADDGTTYIIQCKRYAKKKQIHENVVCQTFGTSLEYLISHKNKRHVVPVIVSTCDLSETAKVFADILEVKTRVIKMGNYPVIKCNIDSGIYHLPFDQQYHSTQIIASKGEFYAWTVKEAEEHGYRRAYKWGGYVNT